METDIRWKQRFHNYQKALGLLSGALKLKPLDDFSDLEKEGLAQRFEYTFELAWKTLKDYLESSGIVIDEVTPRNVIKMSFAANIITDGELWIEMMLARNSLSHIYDIKKLKQVLEELTAYEKAFRNLRDWLSERE